MSNQETLDFLLRLRLHMEKSLKDFPEPCKKIEGYFGKACQSDVAEFTFLWGDKRFAVSMKEVLNVYTPAPTHTNKEDE